MDRQILAVTALLAMLLQSSLAMAQLRTVAKQVASNPAIAAAGSVDPRDFLAEIEGSKALAWVNQHNQSTLDRLSADPRFAKAQAEMLKIAEATDRIPTPAFVHGGMIDNFWQDAQHTQGVWRRTSWDSYRSDQPTWEVVLDIDALSKADGKTWVYHGSDCLLPAQRYCLVKLSEGGADAEVVREFDVQEKRFVENGFNLPAGKQDVTWVDLNTLYVSREWTPGDMTTSGYAYITKRWQRGRPLAEAVEVYRGLASDVEAGRSVLRDVEGNYVIDTANRAVDFFHNKTVFFTDHGPVSLPLPLTSNLAAWQQGQVVYLLKEDWQSAKGTRFLSGAVIAFDLQKALADPAGLEPVVLFQPDEHQSVEGVSQTRSRLILEVLSNVAGELDSYSFNNNRWTSHKLALPANSAISLVSADDTSDKLFAMVSGFLEPATLYRVDSADGTVEKIKSSPRRFNPDGLQVQQHWVSSKDGTQVPYFLITRKDVKHDGTTPTLLYAYGGFEVSSLPGYSAGLGKLWLEQGGAYALANIRGGGEFGPKWHQAGLKIHRQRIYDDFQAVAEDLINSKLTSTSHLGIMGGSNGGLLMGVQLNQRPDLWNAVVVQVPLLDMVNYTHMAAGASWQGEYGNPDDPVEGKFLRSISPYHNVKAGVAYPEPLFETSTRDDRVGPVHARKMAALFEDMGLPFYYYENTEGGHSAAANLREVARRYAIEYTYLYEKLMDNKSHD